MQKVPGLKFDQSPVHVQTHPACFSSSVPDLLIFTSKSFVLKSALSFSCFWILYVVIGHFSLELQFIHQPSLRCCFFRTVIFVIWLLLLQPKLVVIRNCCIIFLDQGGRKCTRMHYQLVTPPLMTASVVYYDYFKILQMIKLRAVSRSILGSRMIINLFHRV